MSQRRPFGVSVLVFFVWLQAIFGIVGGALLLIFRDESDVLSHTSLTSDELLTVAIIAIVVGVITAMVASSLGRGSNFARWLVAILNLFHLAGGIYEVSNADGGGGDAGGIGSIVIALIVLYILFFERGSREFFGGR